MSEIQILAMIAGCFALLWIAISLHILTVHAFEIVRILTNRGGRP